MLIFFAFANRNTGKGKAGFFGIMMAMFVYTLIVLAGITVFGYEELQRLAWPTLELVKTTQVPGLILERLESAFLAVWVAAVFTTVANGYYVVVFGLRQLFNKGIGFQRIVSIILGFVMVYVSLLPQNVSEIFEVSSVMGLISLFVNIGIPCLYWLVILLRGKGIHPKERELDG
jgi:spore germination protein